MRDSWIHTFVGTPTRFAVTVLGVLILLGAVWPALIAYLTNMLVCALVTSVVYLLNAFAPFLYLAGVLLVTVLAVRHIWRRL